MNGTDPQELELIIQVVFRKRDSKILLIYEKEDGFKKPQDTTLPTMEVVDIVTEIQRSIIPMLKKSTGKDFIVTRSDIMGTIWTRADHIQEKARSGT